MSKPRITIGLTAFNAEATVGAALQSALDQTWEADEIIVVDDASTDGTVAAVEAIARRNPKVLLVVSERNGGAPVSRNQIVNRATGDFIAFFDDDDVSFPERIAVQFDKLTAYERDFANGAPAVCHSAREQVYPDGTHRIERTIGVVEGRQAPAGLPVALRILTGAPVRDGFGSCATCSQMARTSTYRLVGGFDPAFRRCDDTEFCIRLARAGGHFVGIAAPLVRQTMTNTSEKGLDREMHDTLAYLAKHRDLIGNEATYQFCRDWVELKYLWLKGRRAAFAAELARLTARHPVMATQRLGLAVASLSSNRAFARLHRAG